MKKSKIILLFSLFLIFILCLNKKIIIPKSNKIEGIIKEIKIKDNKISFVIDNTICNYYFKNKYELKSFKLGKYIKLNGSYKEIASNTNFNAFNYKNYLLGKKIYYQFEVKKFKFKRQKMSFLYQIRNLITERINKSRNNIYLNLFLLGENLLDEDIKSNMKSIGINHLFCISGMHITLFTTFLLFILNKFFKNKILIFIVITIFLFFFAFLVNFSPSILRASLFFIFLNIKNIFKFNISNLYLMLVLLLLLLIYNPFYIYNVGFIYSFIISFFLIIFSDNKKENYFIKIFKTSLISFLAALPINICTNYEINILSPFLNIIYIPFVSFILFPICIINFIFIKFDFVTNILIFLFEQSLFIFSKLNIILYFKKFNSITIVLYYIITVFLLKKRNKYIMLVFIIFMFINYNIRYLINGYNITFIDVKQGDSCLIEMPYNKVNILIDTGGIFYKKTNNLEIINYLKSLGVQKLDYLILTHGDYDHMGEAINLVNNFKVEKVIFNCGPYNDLEKELIKVLDKKKIKYYSCINELNIDKNKLYFLQTKEYDNENDNSNVIYTELNGYKFMFMGDASTTTEKEIINKYNLPDIDVLKVGHHGSKTSSSIEFIDELNPKYSIISVGKKNRYGHPNKEVLDILSNSKIYRTDEDGSIMFKIKNNKLKIETCEP